MQMTTTSEIPPTVGRVEDHLSRLRRADEREKAALARYRKVAEERRAAIVAAYKSGMTITQIANTLGVGHEAIRVIVRASEAEA